MPTEIILISSEGQERSIRLQGTLENPAEFTSAEVPKPVVDFGHYGAVITLGDTPTRDLFVPVQQGNPQITGENVGMGTTVDRIVFHQER